MIEITRLSMPAFINFIPSIVLKYSSFYRYVQLFFRFLEILFNIFLKRYLLYYSSVLSKNLRRLLRDFLICFKFLKFFYL